MGSVIDRIPASVSVAESVTETLSNVTCWGVMSRFEAIPVRLGNVVDVRLPEATLRSKKLSASP